MSSMSACRNSGRGRFVLATALIAFFGSKSPAWLVPEASLQRRSLLAAGPVAVVTSQQGEARAIFDFFAPDIPAPPDVAAVPADAQFTRSGLASKVLSAIDCGTPAECKEMRPTKFDKVTVDYSGWQTDGKMFDSSVKRGQPASFALSEVIKGWTEGVQMMVPGEMRRFWVPADLAYGENPGGGRPGGLLVFDIKLYDVERGPKAPPAPADVAGPPADAEKTASGLASKVLKPGIGKQHPLAGSTVMVDYTGWTADGQLFDSSVMRGRPATFPLDQVIKGWTEGVQLMYEGETRRFWIPALLAYGEKPSGGKPAGPLVFDVKLYQIK
eukprot:TRINITY_DN84556_c0_g1_i1.p1 TRINITY_DN84556_c0_g1~~TRINITY_DN84556_c0_g1_i1.p1  ORF type:complete len:327 (+),score=76.45 TRINITY_DN84556_c0_g1_i1:20-1000(+)